MFSAFDILHGDNWYSLAIAIMYRELVSMEEAFSLYDYGRKEYMSKRQQERIDARAVAYMQKMGMNEREIAGLMA